MPFRSGLLRHPLAIAGVLLTSASAVTFIALIVAAMFGMFENPYAGLVVFVLVPALFVLGLLLIPLGMWLEARARRRHPDTAREWPVLDFRVPALRRWTVLVAALTVVNAVIVLLAAKGTVHWMDSPSFCGQVCHEPMHPQYTAWQSAPHSQVTCAQCHIGEGARALVHAKLAGARQLYHVVTRNIPRPIPGVADMRPALETCGNCHWAGRDFGEPTRTSREYADDEANTETATTLRMFLGGPGRRTSAGRAIHWHADPAVRIEFVYTDAERQTIVSVRSTDGEGRVKEYRAEGATDQQIASGQRRVMDCIDCHNVPAHRIAPTAEQAVDRAIAAGEISRTLPFARREGVRVVKAEYGTQERGLQEIDRELRAFYAGKAVKDDDLARAVAALQNVYRRNVFPPMKVTFGVYPDNSGHMTSDGCLRCHSGSLKASDGAAIGDDCEYCHKEVEQP